jgi:ATP-dependent RNA helicase DDX18/HAS1
VCPADKRFLLLFTFLKRNLKKKVMVFFSSCNSVKYHGELLNYIDIPCLDIHGRQKQAKRTKTFFEFCNAKSGIMLCTDVAARGLDIPAVDWIVQYDPPDEPNEYIHRVGRTARGESGVGRALLFLLPEELGFLRYLKHARVPLNEYEFPQSKVSNVQSQLEALVEKNYYLHRSAKDAYASYLKACVWAQCPSARLSTLHIVPPPLLPPPPLPPHTHTHTHTHQRSARTHRPPLPPSIRYASHQLKNIFEVNKLDLARVGKSFGFSVPPNVNLDVHSSKAGKVVRRGGGGGYGGGYTPGPKGPKDHIAKSKEFKRTTEDGSGRQFAR